MGNNFSGKNRPQSYVINLPDQSISILNSDKVKASVQLVLDKEFSTPRMKILQPVQMTYCNG